MNNKSIIEKYVEAFDKTEIPISYLTFSALSIFSACMGRRVHTDIGLGKIYPNLMIYLVGLTKTHKSTCIKNSLKVLEWVNSYTGNIKIAPTDTAGRKQGLLKTFKHKIEVHKDEVEESIDLNVNSHNKEAIDLAYAQIQSSSKPVNFNDNANNNSLYISAHELTTFFGLGSTELYTLIAELYGNPDIYYYKLSHQDAKLPQPSLSLLGGIKPLALGSLIPKDTSAASILCHTLLVYEEKTGKGRFPIPVINKEILKEIGKSMVKATTVKGLIPLTEDAKSIFSEIYLQEHSSKSFLYSQYRNYRPEFMLKIALIVAVMEGNKQIHRQHIELADKLLNSIEPNMEYAYSEVLATTKASYRQLIKDYIVENLVVTDIELRQALKDIPRAEFEETKRSMVVDGIILEITDGTTIKYTTPQLENLPSIN